MYVYVIGKFEEKVAVREMMSVLVNAGFSISHDWTVFDTRTVPPEQRAEYEEECAVNDLRGVADADAIVMLNHPELYGGMIEMGYALRLGLRVFVLQCNPARDSCFFKLERVSVYTDREKLLNGLKMWRAFADD